MTGSSPDIRLGLRVSLDAIGAAEVGLVNTVNLGELDAFLLQSSRGLLVVRSQSLAMAVGEVGWPMEPAWTEKRERPATATSVALEATVDGGPLLMLIRHREDGDRMKRRARTS